MADTETRADQPAPPRPSFFDEEYAPSQKPGKEGTAIPNIRVNYFDITNVTVPATIWVYSLAFPQISGRAVTTISVKKSLIQQTLRDPFFQTAPVSGRWVTDWNGLVMSWIELETQTNSGFTATTPKSVNINWTNQSQPNVQVPLTVSIQRVHVLDRNDIQAYCSGQHYHNISPWLTAINTMVRSRALQQIPNPRTVKVGRDRFFPLVQTETPWPSGLEPRAGHSCSVHALRGVGDKGCISINMQSVAAAFITPQLLLDYIKAYEPGFTPHQWQTAQEARLYDGDFKCLANQLQVRYTYSPPDPANPQRLPLLPNSGAGGRLKRITGFGQSVRAETFFHSGLGQSLTVENYFNNHVLPPGTVIQHPHLLVVNTGSATQPVWVPPELLKIEPHQAKRGVLEGNDMRWMLRVSQKPPLENITRIEQALQPGANFDAIQIRNRTN